jgi:hypothetical protein
VWLPSGFERRAARELAMLRRETSGDREVAGGRAARDLAKR